MLRRAKKLLRGRRKCVVAVFALALLAFLALRESAEGGSAAGIFGVSSIVPKRCTVSTTPLGFGVYDPISTHSTSRLGGGATVTIVCTKKANATIGLGAGSNAPGSGTTRAMTDGRSRLSYEVYKDSARTQIWGDSGAALLDAGTAPSAAPRSFLIYGVIPEGQDAPAGDYNDTIVVTVNF